jgi:hypothetical protein
VVSSVAVAVAVAHGDVREWFDEFLEAFAACARGEEDTASLLDYYGVPLLLTTDSGYFAVTSGDQVVAAMQQLVDPLRAAAYDRSEILDFEVSILNSKSALYRLTYSRQRSDGSEISQLIATYFVTIGPIGRCLSVSALHSR